MNAAELSKQAYNSFRLEGSMASVDTHLKLFDYRNAVRHELVEKINGKFWIGPDIGTTYDVIIPPNGAIVEVDVTLPYEDLRPFTDFDPYGLSTIEATTRSRFAQLGLEVPKSAFADIARTFYWIPQEDGTKKRFGGIVPAQNWSARPIKMEAGTKFFSGHFWDGETIIGEELHSFVGRDILISGQENETWRWWYSPNSTGEIEDIQGIEFFIDEKSRSWIPPSTVPMSINDGHSRNHNRAGVDKYLHSPVPIRQKPTLIIAQTMADIELTPKVHGLIEMALSPHGLPIGQGETDDIQTNSVFIRGGNTYGKMRSETLEHTGKFHKPQTVLMRFAHAA